MDSPPSKSWSIHTRKEITSKYTIHERIGSGAYADVYRATRKSDSLTVALKEIHDYQSAFREIEALQTLQNCPNIIVLHEFFYSEDEDAVLVLEYLQTDLASVIKAAKKEFSGGLSIGEIKRWMVQILSGVDSCHRSNVVHRDLKPSNLLISSDGVLKLADFGQARILLGPGLLAVDDASRLYEQTNPNLVTAAAVSEVTRVSGDQEQGALCKEGYSGEMDEARTKDSCAETDRESYVHDADTSCLATCTASDVDEDPSFKCSYSYNAEEGGDDGSGPLTSCVGTRWFRAPELLYGSTNYGLEIDLWSLGCIFAELLSLQPLFPGTSDIDQLGKIFSVLGSLTKEVWPGCVKLPDYNSITFSKVENPIGLEACLPNRSSDEISLVKKLLCYNPASRATAMELLRDKYLTEQPLPVPISELRVPSKETTQDDSPGEWGDYRDFDSDSDFDDFGPMKFTTTDNGFSIQFS